MEKNHFFLKTKRKEKELTVKYFAINLYDFALF